MAAGLRQRLAGAEQARAGHLAGTHAFGQRPVGTTGIAHRGKAPVDHALHDGQRAQQRQRVGQIGNCTQVEARGHHVHVAVDQTGHQGHPLGIDDGGIGHLEVFGADLFDQTVAHPNGMSRSQYEMPGVENLGIADQGGLHNRFWRSQRHGCL